MQADEHGSNPPTEKLAIQSDEHDSNPPTEKLAMQPGENRSSTPIESNIQAVHFNLQSLPEAELDAADLTKLSELGFGDIVKQPESHIISISSPDLDVHSDAADSPVSSSKLIFMKQLDYFFMVQFLHGSIFIIQNLYFQKTLQHFSFKNFLDLIIFYTLLLALLTLRFFTI